MTIEGFKTPVMGILDGSKDLQIQILAVKGKIPWTTLRSSSMGAFWDSSLIFTNPVAGQVTALKLLLQAATAINQDETINISLPRFTGETKMNLDYELSTDGIWVRSSPSAPAR